MKILVTGGAGFIGSEVVRQIVRETDWTVVNVDLLTYAGNLESLAVVADHPRHVFERADIADAMAMAGLFARYRPDAVMHLAAESHVDRSIDGPADFIRTNLIGTYTLLDAARRYWDGLDGERKERFRFHHVSTDEVYGSLGPEGAFREDSPYQPNSPYSATKAGSDHLVRAWHHTFGLPVVTTNCSNNYGPYQFPEKLIPHMILNALEGRPLPVYGDGRNVRDWLYVGDHARALRLVLTEGRVGEVYNIGGSAERSNIEIVRTICALMDEMLPDSPYRPHDRLIRFVKDRPGHDRRYAIDAGKIRRELGWVPQEDLASGLRRTVRWYLDHREWWGHILDGSYRLGRLGVADAQ